MAAGLIVRGRSGLAATLAAQSTQSAKQPSAVTAWIRIAPDNTVTLLCSQSEMGQGISTTLTALLADELGVDWTRVRIEFSLFGDAYRNPRVHLMFTGNSESTSTFYDLVRRMGASAREMLTTAAAARLGVAANDLAIDDGVFLHESSGRKLTFGDVASDAAKLPLPEKPRLKDESELRYLGRPLPRWDIPPKVDGSAVFGIDVKVPDMLLAAIRRAPGIGGRLAHYDADALKKKPGVVAVVEIPGGLAVVAKTWWQARRALDQAELTWVDEDTSLTSAAMAAAYAEKLDAGPFATHQKTGDASAALDAAPGKLQAVYEIPFQAHATMEPMNCTAHLASDGCDIWAPTQGVELAQGVAREVTGFSDDKVRVHRTFLGGGFGRRLVADFVKLAVIVAKAVGKPVKLIYTREEDMTQDYYRAAMLHRISGALDASGKMTALAHRVVSPSHLMYVAPRDKDWTGPVRLPLQYDNMAVEGLVDSLYDLPNLLVEQHFFDSKVPVSVWRTTGHGPNNFVLESFIDELAAAAKQDPLAFRRAHLGHNDRVLKLLDVVADQSGWGQPLPANRGRGVAIAQAFGALIAQVAEVSVINGQLDVHRVVSAVDCGRVLDPGIAASNIAGGVVWGLSALRTAVTFERGRVVQSNFHAFEPLHMWETPAIETHFVTSGAALGGLGEIGPVPTHAAVCNAMFSVTGQRIRALPLSKSGFALVSRFRSSPHFAASPERTSESGHEQL